MDIWFSEHRTYIWRRLVKLRPLARSHIHCHIESGHQACFWYDSWTSFGPFLYLMGPIGPVVTGTSLSSKVSQEVSDGNWSLVDIISSDLYASSWLSLLHFLPILIKIFTYGKMMKTVFLAASLHPNMVILAA